MTCCTHHMNMNDRHVGNVNGKRPMSEPEQEDAPVPPAFLRLMGSSDDRLTIPDYFLVLKRRLERKMQLTSVPELLSVHRDDLIQYVDGIRNRPVTQSLYDLITTLGLEEQEYEGLCDLYFDQGEERLLQTLREFHVGRPDLQQMHPRMFRHCGKMKDYL